ncbi:MAG: hypothetical protein GY934_06540, partial [Gammaproteobacteria bacterium]|nr:hypothetical protein [Gammaproteobacteria bacterium]
NGPQGSGPSYWQVWTKSGQTMEYGNSDNAKVEKTGSTDVRTWAVNSIGDVVGNAITFNYYEDNANGEHYPLSIDYGSNSARFEYENRPDPFYGHQGGGKISLTQRLTKITLHSSDSLIQEYSLRYLTNNKSLLAGVTHKDANGNAVPELTFDWDIEDEAEQKGFEPLVRLDYTATNNSQYQVEWGSTNTYTKYIDMNGDGLPDRVNHHNYDTSKYGIWVALNNGSGFDSLVRWEHTPTHNNEYILEWGTSHGVVSKFLDINGDGLPDRVNHYNYQTGQYGIWVALNNGSGFEPMTRWEYTATNNWQYYLEYTAETSNVYSTFLDMNGDGLPDRVNHHNYQTGESGIWVALNTGSGFEPLVRWEYTATHSSQNIPEWGNYSQFLDINGDGLPDRVNHHNYTTGEPGIWVALNNGSGFDSLERWEYTATHNNQYRPQWGTTTVYSQFLDINGDGLPDRVNHHNYTTGESGLWVALNTGSGFEPLVRWEYTAANTNQYIPRWGDNSQFVDINSDGLPDRVNHHNYTTGEYGIWVALNNGSGFDPLERWEYTATHNDQNRPQWGTGNVYSQFLDIDGDGKLDRVNHKNYATGQFGNWVAKSKQKNYKVRSISSGMATTSLTYKPLTNTSVYTKGTDAIYPEIDLAGPMQVVSKVTTPDGLGGTHSTEYKYGGLKAHMLGRGSLGFARMEATNNQTGIVTKTEYSQEYPYVGQVTRTEQRLADNTLLGETSTTFNHTTSHGDKVYFPYTKQTVDKKYDLSGSLLATTTTDNVFDAFANPTQITVTTVDSEDTVVKDTLSDYTNNTDIWHLGRLTRASVTHSNNQGSITRTSAFAYNSNGLLETEIIEPDNPDLRLQTDYQYDSYGNKTLVTTSGQGIESRSSSTTYSADGRFPESVTNALGHSETRTYDPLLGVMTSLTGPNGLTTSWSYDGFGRKIREERADGTWSSITRGQCGITDCPDDAPLGIGVTATTESAGGTPATTFSDKLGRVVRKVKTSFDGTLVYEDTEYNSLGQISRKSQPYFKGETAHWGESEYDILG